MTAETAPMEGMPMIKPSTTDHPLYDTICEAIRTVHDPEIPVNIFDLGLIYTIEIDKDRAGLPCRGRNARMGRRCRFPPARRSIRHCRSCLGTAMGHGYDVR